MKIRSAALTASSVLVGLTLAPIAPATTATLQRVGTVFYIHLENHNWIQPNGNVDPNSTGLQQIKGHPAAPFINGLVDPNNALSADVAYTNKCFNVLANSIGLFPSIHPSEPNYIWNEGGSNYGVTNDADPYQDVIDPFGNVFTRPNVSGLLQQVGILWKSYQEDIDLAPTSGTVNNPGANSLTSTVAPSDQWTVPLRTFNGTSSAYTNPYNGSNQYSFGPKHDGQLFFTATNGGTRTTPDYTTSNPEVPHYLPLQQLAADLANGQVGRYNVITPDLFNDMHDELAGGFTYQGVHYTGDAAHIAQGDNFLRVVVPLIMASSAYQNDGMIVIWTDETESQSTTDITPNDFKHSLAEIIISPLTKGHAYHNDGITYTHSSDVETLQEIFPIGPAQGFPFLGATTRDQAGNRDYGDLFQ